MARVTHLADLMHRAEASNGTAIPSNWILSTDGTKALAWRPETSSSGSVSYGSNATHVSDSSDGGAAANASRSDHRHLGVRSVSHSSNTFFGDLTLQTEGSLYIVKPGPGILKFGSTGGGGGAAGNTVAIEDEGAAEGAADTIDFTGAGVSVTFAAGTASVAIPGGGQEFNEVAAAALVDATSTGDAGSRADHFPGTSIGGAWSTQGTAMGGGPTVKYSVAAFQGAGGASCYLVRPYTPSGAFRIEARARSQSTGYGFGVQDSTDAAAGDAIYTWIDATNAQVYSHTGGAATQRGSNISDGTNWASKGFFYHAVERDGSNNWTLQVSLDRTRWLTIVSGYSQTFTVADIIIRSFGAVEVSFDFIDVVS